MTGTAKKRIHIAGGFLLLVVALVLLFFWNIYSGSVSVEPKDVLRLLFQGPDESTQARILWDIRFPRVLAAMLLGGALSVSGFLLQTFFANPIAGMAPIKDAKINTTEPATSPLPRRNIITRAVISFAPEEIPSTYGPAIGF
jgi:hypothetical protein